jgi:thioredoxin-related protein
MKRILISTLLVFVLMASVSAAALDNDKKERVPVKMENNNKKSSPIPQHMREAKVSETKSYNADNKSEAKAKDAKSAACTNKGTMTETKSCGKK